MRRRTRYALAIVLALALTAGLVGAGWATPPNPYTSTISGPGFANQLTATVTNNADGSYHYLYTFVFVRGLQPTSKLSAFSVGNPTGGHFFNWGCSQPSMILNQASTDSVLWQQGSVSPNTTVTFWYDSFSTYGLVNVTATAAIATGAKTLGMVPEPAGLAAIAVGIIGLLPTIRRRR